MPSSREIVRIGQLRAMVLAVRARRISQARPTAAIVPGQLALRAACGQQQADDSEVSIRNDTLHWASMHTVRHQYCSRTWTIAESCARPRRDIMSFEIRAYHAITGIATVLVRP